MSPFKLETPKSEWSTCPILFVRGRQFFKKELDHFLGGHIPFCVERKWNYHSILRCRGLVAWSSWDSPAQLRFVMFSWRGKFTPENSHIHQTLTLDYTKIYALSTRRHRLRGLVRRESRSPDFRFPRLSSILLLGKLCKIIPRWR